MVFGLFKKENISTDVFAPPRDEVFSYLYSRVVVGLLPLYRADVPLNSIKLFSNNFSPHQTTAGRKCLNGMIREYKAGNFYPTIWLYPHQDVFILSDDYLCYFLLKELGADFHTCEIMGAFSAKGLSGVKGPAPIDYVRALPGGPEYDATKAKMQVIKEVTGD